MELLVYLDLPVLAEGQETKVFISVFDFEWSEKQWFTLNTISGPPGSPGNLGNPGPPGMIVSFIFLLSTKK